MLVLGLYNQASLYRIYPYRKVLPSSNKTNTLLLGVLAADGRELVLAVLQIAWAAEKGAKED
jgi:hypothetical protein